MRVRLYVRCGSIGDFIGDLGQWLAYYDSFGRRRILTTSTPRFLATAMTVLRVPKSTPTTDILAYCLVGLTNAFKDIGRKPVINEVSVVVIVSQSRYHAVCRVRNDCLLQLR